MFFQGIMLFSGFLNGVIITRSLGPVGRGEYALINFLVTILLVIMGEGIYRSNIYLVSQDKSEQNINSLSVNLVLHSLLVTVIFFVFLCLPENLYKIFLPGIKPLYVYLGLGTALFFIVIRQFQGLFLGLQKYWHYNFFNSLPIVLFLLLDVITLLLLKQLTTTIVLVNFFISMGITFLVAVIVYFRKYKLKFLFSWLLVKKNFQTGWRATIAYLLIFLLIKMNLYIVNQWSGLAEAGLFALAVSLAALIQQIPNVAGVVMMPKVSGQNSSQKLPLVNKIAFSSLAFCLIVSAFIYLAGEKLLILAYTEEFAASYLPLCWLLPGIICYSFASIFHTALWGRGFPTISLIGPVGPLVVNLILCYYLIPVNGIVGAAQAATFSLFLYSVIILSYVVVNRKQLNE